MFFFWKKMLHQKHEKHGAKPLVGFRRRQKRHGANLSCRMSSVSVKCFVFFLKLGAVRFTKKIPKKEGCMAKEDEYRGGIISLFFLWFFLNKFYGSFLMRADIFVEIRSLAHFGSPDVPFYHHKKRLPVKQDKLSNQPSYVVICILIYYIYLYTFLSVVVFSRTRAKTPWLGFVAKVPPANWGWKTAWARPNMRWGVYLGQTGGGFNLVFFFFFFGRKWVFFVMEVSGGFIRQTFTQFYKHQTSGANLNTSNI